MMSQVVVFGNLPQSLTLPRVARDEFNLKAWMDPDGKMGTTSSEESSGLT